MRISTKTFQTTMRVRAVASEKTLTLYELSRSRRYRKFDLWCLKEGEKEEAEFQAEKLKVMQHEAEMEKKVHDA